MFARSIAVLGAATMIVASAGADAEARGGRRGCCQTTTCLQRVVSPPVYRTVMETVMVQPERCSIVQTPAVYQTQHQQVVVQPERQVVHSTPAVYGRVRVTEQVSPGYTKWRTRRGCCGVQYRCAVNVAPRYRTRRQRVEIQPAAHRVEVLPAVTGTVARQVMVNPGTSRRVCQPPVYRQVARQVLVSAGTEQWVPVAHRGTCRR